MRRPNNSSSSDQGLKWTASTRTTRPVASLARRSNWLLSTQGTASQATSQRAPTAAAICANRRNQR